MSDDPGGNSIIAVTFDVWETLINDTFENGTKRSDLRAARMADVLRRHGHAVDASRVRLIYRQANERLEQEVWSKYLDVSTEEKLLVFMSTLEPCMPSPGDETILADLEDAYTSPFFDLPPTLAPGAAWALAAIQEKGLRVGLICNTGVTPGRDIRRLLEGYGVLQYFEALAFSDEEGIRKPQPEIFRRTLARLGVSPALAVHIGDDAISDIAGAKGDGMKAIMVRASLPSRLPVVPDFRVDSLFGVPEAIQSL